MREPRDWGLLAWSLSSSPLAGLVLTVTAGLKARQSCKCQTCGLELAWCSFHRILSRSQAGSESEVERQIALLPGRRGKRLWLCCHLPRHPLTPLSISCLPPRPPKTHLSLVFLVISLSRMLKGKEPVYFRIICAGSQEPEAGALTGYSEASLVAGILGSLENWASNQVSL